MRTDEKTQARTRSYFLFFGFSGGLNCHTPRDFVTTTRPSDDAPAKVGHIVDPLLHQEGAGMVGAGPAAAVEHDFLVFGKVRHAQRN